MGPEIFKRKTMSKSDKKDENFAYVMFRRRPAKQRHTVLYREKTKQREMGRERTEL